MAKPQVGDLDKLLMDFQQARHSIDVVIHWIKIGRIGLPDFQREFVWTPSQVAELLDSVARQWPIGSLLLLNGPQPFAFRAIDSAPELIGPDLDTYILDGQQRVTALYHAIADMSKYCYYVDFNELKAGASELIRWSSRKAFERQYKDVRARASVGIATISDLWDQPKFFNWLNDVPQDALRMEFLQLRDQKLAGLQSKVYHVMALELDQRIGLEALARIFETINRTGVALNAFDLLVAKLYPTGFNLREKWEEALDSNPMLRHFQPSELEVLKLISLLIRRRWGRKSSKGVRQGDLLSLDVHHIIGLWDEGVGKYVSALHTAVSYGVVCKELVPSWSMILGLAGCEDYLNKESTFQWWRDAILQQTYLQGANTKIMTEFDAEMRPSLTVEHSSLSFDELNRRSVRSNGLLANGMFGLMIRAGARDPQTGSLLLHANSVVVRRVGPDGRVSLVGHEDTLSNAILFSAESAKSMRRGEMVDTLGSWRVGLQSQGVDSVLLKRPARYIQDLFGLEVKVEKG